MRIEECHLFQSKLLPLTILCGLLILFTSCGQSLESHLERGEEFLQKRKYSDAEMQFRAGVSIDEDSAEAHWGLARTFEKQGKFLETVQELKRTADIDETHLDAKTKLGNYFLLFNPPQIQEAERLLQDVLARDAKFIEAHILKASVFALQNKEEGGIVAVLNHAISLDTKRTESYLALARFYMKRNNTHEAEETIKRAISVNDKRALGYLEYARFLGFAKRRDEVEAKIKKAIEVEPKSIEAREALASHYLSRREIEKAEQTYKELVRVQENSPESRMDLANFYSLVSRRDEAVKVYNEILAENTDYARARYKLAEVFLGRKDFKKVNAEVEKLLSVNDTDAEALMLRARVKLAEGMADEAVKDLEEVLKNSLH